MDKLADIFAEPLGSGSFHANIADSIREAVSDGRLRHDDKLPSEEQLAKWLQVHRGTVNRSYATLKAEGVLKGERGRGTFVKADLERMPLNGRRAGKGARAGTKTVAILKSLKHASESRRLDRHIQMDVMEGLLAGFSGQAVDLKTVPFSPSGDGQDILERLAEVDGVILAHHDSQLLMTDTLMEVLSFDRPLVTTMWRPGTAQVPTVTYDRTLGTYLAAQHLISLGHTRIGACGLGVFSRKIYKFGGYVEAMHEAGLDILSRDVISSDEKHFGYGEAYARMEARIRQGDLPTAFVFETDTVALEALLALKSAGLRVPEDISIVGHNNREAHDTDPPLTSVDKRHFEVGRLAAEKLLAWMDGGERPDHAVVEPELIVRASTAVPAKRGTRNDLVRQ